MTGSKAALVAKPPASHAPSAANCTAPAPGYLGPAQVAILLGSALRMVRLESPQGPLAQSKFHSSRFRTPIRHRHSFLPEQKDAILWQAATIAVNMSDQSTNPFMHLILPSTFPKRKNRIQPPRSPACKAAHLSFTLKPVQLLAQPEQAEIIGRIKAC